jgi:hypothetical protein
MIDLFNTPDVPAIAKMVSRFLGVYFIPDTFLRLLHLLVVHHMQLLDKLCTTTEACWGLRLGLSLTHLT